MQPPLINQLLIWGWYHSLWVLHLGQAPVSRKSDLNGRLQLHQPRQRWLSLQFSRAFCERYLLQLSILPAARNGINSSQLAAALQWQLRHFGFVEPFSGLWAVGAARDLLAGSCCSPGFSLCQALSLGQRHRRVFAHGCDMLWMADGSPFGDGATKPAHYSDSQAQKIVLKFLGAANGWTSQSISRHCMMLFWEGLRLLTVSTFSAMA